MFVCDFTPLARKRPSKGIFDVALSLVCQPTCRLFGKGQMSLSLFRYNTNVDVVLNLWDARLKYHERGMTGMNFCMHLAQEN